MLYRGRSAETFITRPDPHIWCVLAFGDDEGVVSDATRLLMKSWAGAAELETTLLDEETIRKDPAVLFDALEAVSLLGSPRCVRICIQSERIAAILVSAIETGDQARDRFAARLVIEAGALPSRSRLRQSAENAANAASLSLANEDETSLRERVRLILERDNVTIEPDALELFLGDLPGHRAIANSEINKLALYGAGLGRALNREDIAVLSTTQVRQMVSSIILACLDGCPATAGRAFERALENGTGAISVLRSLQVDVLRMLRAHDLVAAGDRDPGRQLRPPVWQSEWPSFSARLRIWSPKRLVRVLERIHDAERHAKLSGASADAVVRVLINDLARAAERAR